MAQNNNQDLIIRNDTVNGLNFNPERMNLPQVVVQSSDYSYQPKDVINTLIKDEAYGVITFPAASDITYSLFGDSEVISGYRYKTYIYSDNDGQIVPGAGITLHASSDEIINQRELEFWSIINSNVDIDLYAVSV